MSWLRALGATSQPAADSRPVQAYVPSRHALDSNLATENAYLTKQVNDLTAEVTNLRQQLNTFYWRRIAEQDRRNATALCDALALSEGRQQMAPLSDDRLARRLRNTVRRAVDEVLHGELRRRAS